MPMYTMQNKSTGEVVDMRMSISEMVAMTENGEWKQIIGAPSLVSHTGNIVNKTPDSWKSHLKSIKKSAGKQVANTIKT